MTPIVSMRQLQRWLAQPGEIALIDVREPGQFDAGHLFAAVPAPYSRLELVVPHLLPNPTVRIVLCDAGDGVGDRAAARLAGMGYTDVRVLEGPPQRWRDAGCDLFEGVNTMSKAFGELVEQSQGTPHVSARELRERIDRGEDVIVVDGRPPAEFRRMSIPGATCCPNGELALRIASLAPDPDTTIVVNCAGRTRSIIGAESLRMLRVPNPVYALENGTQGWYLAGFALERGSTRVHGAEMPEGATLAALQARTADLMRRRGVPRVDAATVNAWRADRSRTTYVFDVGAEAEFAAAARPGVVHAPGGQLLQATDQWIAVRGARTVLLDPDGVRAGVIAAWLRWMGHEAVVLESGAEGELELRHPVRLALPELPRVEHESLGDARIIDLRSSAAYRAGHAPGAVWSVRPRVVHAAGEARRVALVAADTAAASLAALDLADAGIDVLGVVADAPLTPSSPGVPSASEAIDFAAFAHGRHDGNRAAAELYLSWETQLPKRLGDHDRALFGLEFARRRAVTRAASIEGVSNP
jgi:rhodanese-related sulfurtransferase